MDKLDYKKAYKELYLPQNHPAITDVPSMRFAIIDGQGDPNTEEFALATAALYNLSYAVKMSYKSKEIPEGIMIILYFHLRAFGIWLTRTNQILTKAILHTRL